MSGAAARTSIAKKNKDNKYIKKGFEEVRTKRRGTEYTREETKKPGSLRKIDVVYIEVF